MSIALLVFATRGCMFDVWAGTPRVEGAHAGEQPGQPILIPRAIEKTKPVGYEPTQFALVELESAPIRPIGQAVSAPTHA